VQDVDAPADPSGPVVPWTHWVVVNIPPSAKGRPEGFSSGKEGEMGGVYENIKGPMISRCAVWRWPMPPSDGHRLEFKLWYALDDMVHLGNKVCLFVFIIIY